MAAAAKVSGPYEVVPKTGHSFHRVLVKAGDFVQTPRFKTEREAKAFAREARRAIREAKQS